MPYKGRVIHITLASILCCQGCLEALRLGERTKEEKDDLGPNLLCRASASMYSANEVRLVEQYLSFDASELARELLALFCLFCWIALILVLVWFFLT